MQSSERQSGGPAAELTAFQRDLITIIADADAPSGIDLKTRLEQAWDVEDIGHGRLYPNLDELVDLGLVEKGEHDKRTNAYHLSEQGSALLAEDLAWRSSKVDGANGEDSDA